MGHNCHIKVTELCPLTQNALLSTEKVILLMEKKYPNVLNGTGWKVLQTEWPFCIVCFHVLLPLRGDAVDGVGWRGTRTESLNGKNRWAIRLRDSPWQFLKGQLDCLNNEAFVTFSLNPPHHHTHTHTLVSMWNNMRRQPGEGVSTWVHGKLDLLKKDRCWQKDKDNTCLNALKELSLEEWPLP